MSKDRLKELKKTISIEQNLLKALSNKSNYKRYFQYINLNNLLPETALVLNDFEKYYDIYDHEDINHTTFISHFTTSWHGNEMPTEDIEVFTKQIKQLSKVEDTEAEKALLGLVNNEFIQKINKIAEKDFTDEDIKKAFDNYKTKRSNIVADYDDDCCTVFDIDFTEIDKDLGLPYFLPELQEALGGMTKDSSVIVNAASGLGKTMFVISQAAFTIKYLLKNDIHNPVLYFNTEGQKSKVWAWLWSNLYRNSFEGGYKEIIKNKEKIQKHFIEKDPDIFKVYAGRAKGLGYVRSKIEKHNPSLVILDMAADIGAGLGNKNSSDASRLKFHFDMIREMSAEYCPIMSTVQAGGGAKWYDKDEKCYKYKRFPGCDEIYGSKSAVQGSAETIITIGTDKEHSLLRFIDTSKTKTEDTAKFTCEVVKKYFLYT